MNRRGFTLLELLVALTLAAIAMAMAYQLFAAAAEGARRLSQADRRSVRQANAHRWLDDAWRNLEVGTAEAGGFDGAPAEASFSSWLLTAHGWPERRRVTLMHDGEALRARWGAAEVTLVEGVAGVEFDYLLEPGADARWVRAWVSPASAPLAVRMRLHRRRTGPAGTPRIDTLLFLVKARG